MRNYVFLLLAAFIAINANAATNISTPTVAGHWTISGSPYAVFNDIRIDVGSTLTIDPGVEVVFQGYYSLEVAGSLIAQGSSSSSILFHVSDTTGWYVMPGTAGGWKGIVWDYYTGTSADATVFKYCTVADVKFANLFLGYRTDKLEYCDFKHCISSFPFYGSGASTKELSYCTIHDCRNWTSPGYLPSNLINYVSTAGTTSVFRIHNCSIYNNTGEAPFIHTSGGTVVFDNNNLYGNVVRDSVNAHGTMYMESGTCTVKDNKIYGNIDAEDAPIHALNCRLTMERNLICNNKSISGMATGYMCGMYQGGGGIRIQGNPDSSKINVVIRNNVIANNYSGFGGGAIYVINANVEIVNNQIVNNSGYRGGGVTFNSYPSSHPGKAIVKNNLFYNNVTIGPNSVTSVYSAYADTLVFENNFVQSNISRALDVNPPGTIDISLVLIGDTTKNIIGNDPGLIAPTLTSADTESALAANFGLISTSSCVNKGNSSGVNYGLSDYAHNNRIYGTTIDIGAYEYGASYVAVPYVSNTLTKMQVYPNPASGSITISCLQANGSIYLQDISGRVVAEKEVNNLITSLDINLLPRGIYLVSWASEGTVQAQQKIVLE